MNDSYYYLMWKCIGIEKKPLNEAQQISSASVSFWKGKTGSWFDELYLRLLWTKPPGLTEKLENQSNK